MKKFLKLLLAASLVFALTACSSSTSGEEDGPVQIVLTLWDEVQAPVIQENVDKFNEANAGEIEATIEIVPWSNYWTKLDASLETSDSADVMWMNPTLPKYADGGVVQPIDQFIEADGLDMSQYVQARVDAYNYKGEQYAMPKGLDAVYVAYNKEIFDKYGVEYPQDGWNWDDMRAIAEELRVAIEAASGTEYPIVMELDAQPSWVNFITQNGGYYLTADGLTTGVGTPESLDAFQQVVDLMEVGHMAPYIVLSETKGTDLFVSGQGGIVFIGSWKASVLENSTLGVDGNIGLVQMPSMAVDNKSVLGGLGYCMAANTEHPEEAWELMKFLTSEESERAEAAAGIDFPANIAAQDAYVSSFVNIDAQVISDAAVSGFKYPSNGYSDWSTPVTDAVALVLSGEAPVETIAEAAVEGQEIIDERFK